MKSGKIIGVIGASSANADDYSQAYEVGKLIALNKCVLLCGGMGGVMEAACKGAKSENGSTIGILPGESPKAANEFVDFPVVTGLGEARNIIVVRSSQVIIAVGGGFGTLSELAFALKLNIPVIGINTWNVSERIHKTHSAKEAVTKAIEFLAANTV